MPSTVTVSGRRSSARASSIASATVTRCDEDEPVQRGRERGPAHLETVDRAWRCARPHGVDHDRRPRVREQLDERAGVSLELDAAEPVGGQQPHGIVAAEAIPDADYERSTSSVRKCVAQEMHGSWLRIACSQRWRSSSSARSAWRCDDRAQVLLDRELVLRRRRDDPRVEDRAVVVDLVAVPAACRAAPRLRRNRRPRAASTSTAGSSGGSYAAIIRSASSHA